MMRARIAWTIYGKELLETLRDRRTMAAMVLLPIVLYPSLIVVSSQVMTHEVARLRSRPGRVAVIGELPAELRRLAESNNMVCVTLDDVPAAPASMSITPPVEADEDNPWMRFDVEVPEPLLEWAGRYLANRRVELVVVVPAELPALVREGRTAPLVLLCDETVELSRVVNDRFCKQVVRWRYRLREARRLEHAGLPDGFFYPVVIEEKTTASSEKRGGFIAGRIIPMVLVVMMLLGAFYPAVDLTAGEKERGTMQTLMTAPARVIEIIIGKFMAVFTVAMIAATANLLSMAMAIAWLLNSAPNRDELALGLSLGKAAIVLVQMVPIAVFVSAVMLAVAVFARSFKEAQNYLTPVVFVVMIPTSMAVLLSVHLDPVTACAPILNFVLMTRELLVKPPTVSLMAVVLLSNSIYAAVALGVAVRIFQNENVLLGGGVAASSPRRLTPAVSLGVYAVGFLVLLFVGAPLQRHELVSGVLVTQWVLLALPAVLLARSFGPDWRGTLLLRRPSGRALLGAALLGLTAFVVVGYPVSALQERFLPMPAELREELRRAIGVGDAGLSTWTMLAAFAFSPAVCEELFFRGLLMSGFRGYAGKWTTIVTIGLLFGIFHVSLYRILPTALLGMLIAWAVYRSGSLWTGVVLHGMNNGVALLLERFAGGGALSPPEAGWRFAAAASLAFVVGILFVKRGASARPYS